MCLYRMVFASQLEIKLLAVDIIYAFVVTDEHRSGDKEAIGERPTRSA